MEMKLQRMIEQPVRTRFRRYECKYLVPESLASEIRSYAWPYLVPDPYAALSEDRSYVITSLYLDSPDLKLFWETEEGVLNRIKLRIRSYDDLPESRVFMEIKRRFNTQVLKGRARVEAGVVDAILDGGAANIHGLRDDQNACCGEFIAWVDRWLARPTVWVRYRREAYVGAFNSDVRITMDRNLSCAPAVGRSTRIRPSTWRPIETRNVVLELKFDEAYPDWMSQLIRRFELEKRSYSKYGNAVRAGVDNPYLSAVDAWSLSRDKR